MKARSGEKIKLTSIDELLGVSNSVTAEEIDIAEIHPFKDHPFKVLDDEKMQELVESIEENGILTPVIVRADPAGGYEMISGHRRMHAATLLGMTAIPAVVKNLDDDDATIVMIDANIQREELLPSDKAFAYKMKYEAMKRKAGRPGKNGKQLTARNLPVAIKNSSQFERNLETAEIIGQQVGESRAQVHRFMRLTELWVLWVLAVVVERLYSFSHGIVLGLLIIPILLARFFRMWQNALIFAAVGAAGYLVLALVVSVEVLLETARAAVIGMMKY